MKKVDGEPRICNPNRLPVTVVRGLPFPGHSTSRCIDEAINFKARDGDVIVCAYPMAASTWLLRCLWKIFTSRFQGPDNWTLENFLYHILELTGTRALRVDRSPRILRCNLPFTLMNNINPRAKYIYITRNPKDVVVSYYFNAMTKIYSPIRFGEFWNDFMGNGLPYGNYFEHVRSWYSNRMENVLFLNYEAMHVNPKQNILDIANFISHGHYHVCSNDFVMNRIVNYPDYDHRFFTVEGNSVVECMPQLVAKHAFLKTWNDAYERRRSRSFLNTGYIGIWRHYLPSEMGSVMTYSVTSEFAAEIFRTPDEFDLFNLRYM